MFSMFKTTMYAGAIPKWLRPLIPKPWREFCRSWDGLFKFSKTQQQKSSAVFLRVLCVFERDKLRFSSKIIRRHCGRSKFHIKCRLARRTVLKNILLKTNFTSTFQNSPILYCSFFIYFHLFQHPLVTPGPSSLPRFYLKPLQF